MPQEQCTWTEKNKVLIHLQTLNPKTKERMESKWQSFLLTILLDTLTLILSLSRSCFIIFPSFQLLANKVSGKKPSIYFGLFSPLLFFAFFLSLILWYFLLQYWPFLIPFSFSQYIYPLNFHPSLDNERGEKERKVK